MTPKSIYALFLKVLPVFKDRVSGFITCGSDAIIIFVNGDNGVSSKFLFTIIDAKKPRWILEPFTK